MRSVAVVAVIVDDNASVPGGGGWAKHFLPAMGEIRICAAAAASFSSWILAKNLTHLLHAFVVGILFEMFAQRDAEKHDRPRRRLRCRLKKTWFIAVSFFICITSVEMHY